MRVQPKRRRGSLRVALPVFAIAVAFSAFPLVGANAEPVSLYLESDGTPNASLSSAAPQASSLSNHDPARNGDPGLTVQKGGKKAGESDPTKHQLWVGPVGGMALDGPVSFRFWSAMKDFDPDKKGAVRAYLLDCNATGSDCSEIGSATKLGNPWAESGSWISKTLGFGSVNHTIAADRTLGLKIVVRDNAGDDMWFAYDSAAYPSNLSLELAAISPTTTTEVPTPTTTTTTTTTTEPPNATTTTEPPNATTTTTTTTSSSTTMPPENPTTTSTTTTTPATTTSLPDQPPPATNEPPAETLQEPPSLDVAMAALPEQDDIDGDRQSHSMSTALFEGLDVAIPPLAAAAILSPLMIAEALLSAFVETGRELLIPSVLLLLTSIWMYYDTRRHRNKTSSEAA